jgi:hypothetical protein
MEKMGHFLNKHKVILMNRFLIKADWFRETICYSCPTSLLAKTLVTSFEAVNNIDWHVILHMEYLFSFWQECDEGRVEHSHIPELLSPYTGD